MIRVLLKILPNIIDVDLSARGINYFWEKNSA